MPNHLDILLFGPAGAGKTSLIKTFYRALHEVSTFPDQIESILAVKDRFSNEGTTKFTRVTIKPDASEAAMSAQLPAEEVKKPAKGKGSTEPESIESSKIVIHDTRGQIWMDEREMAQLNMIIQGKIADKSMVEQRNFRYAYMLWEFWKRDTELFPAQIMQNRGTGISAKPHCICFVFDGSMDEIPSGEEETQFYKDILQMAQSRGYVHPQVVLTCMDKVE